jgi:hypothetical protein
MSVIINIGRHPENDFVISESFISSHHAQLIRDEAGQWFIHDLRSANGTYVNGERIAGPIKINEEDLILLGGSLLPWKDIYQKYKMPDQPVKSYKSKLYHYLLALGVVVGLFVILYLVNELILSSSKGSNNNLTKSNADPTINNNKKETAKVSNQSKQITYDLSCVTFGNSSKINDFANKIDSIEDSFINNSGVTVTLEEEIDFGDQNHRQFLNGSTVLINADSRRLEKILQDLVLKIPQPRGFPYKLFLIDSRDINSWTSGGRIYFTTAMLEFTQNDDEVAGILGHEINHNELNHINHMLKSQKVTMQKTGINNGNVLATINKILRAPFGKKDEAHCDLKGEDLLIAAGYDPCKVIDLWSRMAENEDEHTDIDSFLRSHPYAESRVTCIENHLRTNYNIDCNKK